MTEGKKEKDMSWETDLPSWAMPMKRPTGSRWHCRCGALLGETGRCTAVVDYGRHRETHVHDWRMDREREMGGVTFRWWSCVAPGCRTLRYCQVEKIGHPYPYLPETEP
jgi:hypothetical protein